MYNALPRIDHAHPLAPFVLERMAEGTVIADATGRILWMNSAAQEMLRDGDGLGVRNGVLEAGRAFENARLQHHLQAAVEMAAGNAGGGAMVVGRPSGEASYALLISPLGPEVAHDDWCHAPTALVIIKDSSRHARQVAARLGDFFGLSAAEHRLAIALLEGRTLQETALQLNRAIPTLRTQLRDILKKTGARGQADLIRILLSLPTMQQHPA